MVVLRGRPVMMSRNYHAEYRGGRGISLPGFLGVVVILVTVIVSVVPWGMRHFDKPRSETAAMVIENLSSSIEFYRLQEGEYPPNLQALVKQPSGIPSWNGPYIKNKTIPEDPWGREYIYRYPGLHGPYDLYTLGKDHLAGGEGEGRDIVSWE